MKIDEKVCKKCQSIFRKKASDSKKYWRRKRYCSIKCSGTTFRKGIIPYNKGKKGLWGSDSPSYKGGRNIATNGYIRILIPGTGSYLFEHRLVMEKKLGRKLKSNEIVHHVNGIRHDNREENLEILDKRNHDRFETKRRWRDNSKPFRPNLK